MWDNQGEVLIGKFGIDEWAISKNLEVAMFDLDDTLIKPKEKVKPGAPYTKWAFGKGIIKTISTNQPQLLVIISNQAKLDQYRESFQTKIEAVIHELRKANIKMPVLMYVANGYNRFRKPSTGVITEYLVPFLTEAGVQKITKWCYVGDAAGRKSDHSDSDRKFAMNINMILRGKNKIGDLEVPNLIFMEPEVYFQGSKPLPFVLSGFDPQKFINSFLKDPDGSKIKISELDVAINYLQPINDEQEVILLVGPPGIGKSALAKRIEREWDYVRINQDALGSKSAVDKELQQTLQSGHSIVLDSTNGNLKRRREQIAIVSKYFRDKGKPVHIRAFVMAGDLSTSEQRALAQHLNIVRERGSGENVRQRVPEIVYRLYYKDYVPPSEDEGFTEIVNVKFVPRFLKPEDALHFLQRT
jgi:bifunctional polynucleotide phosphatase/kinase